MKVSILFPHLRGWVLNLANVWPAYIVKPNFAIWEVFHILSLVLLGGTSILIGLRLAGAGLTDERPSEVYRGLRRWQTAGLVGMVVTGGLIGMANAERLYDSPAFLVKMIALVAGIILTYGAVAPAALTDGRPGGRALAAALVAFEVWVGGIWVFLTGGLITPGLLHVLTAAALVVAVLVRGRLRWVYLAGIGLILLAMYLATHVFIPAGDLEHADPANLALAWLMALWIAGGAVGQYLQSGARSRDRLMSAVIGYGAILVWVTAAAAGRWIAFA